MEWKIGFPKIFGITKGDLPFPHLNEVTSN